MRGVWPLNEYRKVQGRIGIHGWLQVRLGVSAAETKIKNNLYHCALFNWHVEDILTIPNPGPPAYYPEEFFTAIRSVQQEGLFNIKH